MSFLKISNVSKSYLDGEQVYQALKNINLEFNLNEFVALVGESGSGKSTLLNLIIGISDITQGNIYFKDENISKFSNSQMDYYRNNEIGIIFQKYNLIDLYNIYENIDIVRNSLVKKSKIKTLLKNIGISHKTFDRINESSGGEMQRAACIRALINNPSLLILDEPTGALDEENSLKLMEYLDSIRKDKLIILVTHNRELANKYASRIIELKDGEVIKDSDNKRKESNYELSEGINNNLKCKYKLKFVINLIKKKRGRFIISLLSSFFLLFFISISLVAINVTNEYINFSFLSSLNAGVIDLKSYELDHNELKEIDVSLLVINELKKNENIEIRKNYDDYLNINLLDNLDYRLKDKRINLLGVSLACTSKYSKVSLKKGQEIKKINEVIINDTLYNYLSNNNEVILNTRIKFKSEIFLFDEFIIKGVSYSSLMNESLIIYFDYSLVNDYFKGINISKYQIDIKEKNKIDEVIKELKESQLYKEKETIVKDEINYSFEYSLDLENYYTFYELINLAKIVIFFFLGLSLIISVMLLSNVLYSFNEEEKKNLAILKVLGFSYFDLLSLSCLLSVIISLASFILILFLNKYLNNIIESYLIQILGFEINLSLSITNYLIMFVSSFLLAIVSSIFPLIKLRLLKLDNILKEE